eukprot:gene12470-15677_t
MYSQAFVEEALRGRGDAWLKIGATGLTLASKLQSNKAAIIAPEELIGETEDELKLLSRLTFLLHRNRSSCFPLASRLPGLCTCLSLFRCVHLPPTLPSGTTLLPVRLIALGNARFPLIPATCCPRAPADPSLYHFDNCLVNERAPANNICHKSIPEIRASLSSIWRSLTLLISASRLSEMLNFGKLVSRWIGAPISQKPKVQDAKRMPEIQYRGEDVLVQSSMAGYMDGT